MLSKENAANHEEKRKQGILLYTNCYINYSAHISLMMITQKKRKSIIYQTQTYKNICDKEGKGGNV